MEIKVQIKPHDMIPHKYVYRVLTPGEGTHVVGVRTYSTPRSAKVGAARWLARMGNEIQSVDYEGWDCVLQQEWFVWPKSKFITKRKDWQDILTGLESRGMIEVIK